MKSTLIVGLIAAISGLIGWMFNDIQPNALEASTENISQVVAKKAVGTDVSTSVRTSSETPLKNNGDTLFSKRFYSTFWVKTHEEDGTLGTKHAFVQVSEEKPMSGVYKMGGYVAFDRPDLKGNLQEAVKQSVSWSCIGSWMEIHQSGNQRVALMRVFFEDPNRVISLPVADFPSTEEELWKLVEPRLHSGSLARAN